jgi:phage-related protein
MGSENEIKYEAIIFKEAKDFIEGLSLKDIAKVKVSIATMQIGKWGSINVKTLRNSIKELIIKNYRFIFFIHKNFIYFVEAFVKKTQKTPKQEIDKAETIYKNFIKDNIKDNENK